MLQTLPVGVSAQFDVAFPDGSKHVVFVGGVLALEPHAAIETRTKIGMRMSTQ
jgi:hypothetical protein